MSFLNISLFLLLNYVVVSKSGDFEKCSGTVVINAPLDGVLEKWYPEDFQNNHTLLISGHHKCAFKIECRKGWTARVILTVNTTARHPSVKILDQFGIVDYVFTTSNEHFYFNEKGGLIELNTGHHKTHFGFKVDWVENKKIPSPSAIEYVMAFFQNRDVEYSHNYYLNVSYNYLQAFKVQTSAHYIMKTEARVSVTVIASSNKMDKQLLRSVYVYDGPNLESPCIGTAYQLWKMKSQYVSSGKYITIQFASRDIKNNRWTIFVQDYATTNHITQFQGVTCKSGHNCGVFELDASNGPVALQTIYDENFEEKEVITGTEDIGYLTIHMGGTKKDLNYRLTWYNGTDKKYLPQIFVGPLKSYVLHNGTMKINITRKTEEFRKTRTLERQGFISSNWLGRLGSLEQYVYDEVSIPDGYSDAKFEYRILYLGMSGNAKFKVIGFKNGKRIYEKEQTTSISNFTMDKGRGFPETFKDEFRGDKFAVDFDARGYSSGGAIVLFAVTEN